MGSFSGRRLSLHNDFLALHPYSISLFNFLIDVRSTAADPFKGIMHIYSVWFCLCVYMVFCLACQLVVFVACCVVGCLVGGPFGVIVVWLVG